MMCENSRFQLKSSTLCRCLTSYLDKNELWHFQHKITFCRRLHRHLKKKDAFQYKIMKNKFRQSQTEIVRKQQFHMR